MTGPALSWTNILATISVFFVASAGGWAVFQQQFATTNKEIESLLRQIDRNRDTAVPRLEHEEFVKRLDREIATINDRLRIIETTRPTTGELSAIGQNNKETANEIKERIRSLEDNLRRPNPLSPVTPPAPYYPPAVPAPAPR